MILVFICSFFCIDLFVYCVRWQVFSAEQEETLKKYLLRSAAMFYGLTYVGVRRLAYGFAVKLKGLKLIMKVPPAWRPIEINQDGIASKDWLYGFMQRHPDLVLRKPQATSLARATAFNRHTVKLFFDNLKDVIARFNIESQNIWNMDETALTTAQKPCSVVAKRGVRNLGAMTSAERGVLVTLALAASAGGVCLPPFYIFPRAKFHDHFLASAGFGADGAANPSGWMKGEQFLKFLRHFKKHARPSVEQPALLIFDNHESHMTIAGLDFCKENGIIVLTLPPHSSNKLQPLDKSVFAPIKRRYNAACDNWMRLPTNAAKTITMHDIPGLSRLPIQEAATISNIQSGFRVTGICPLNEDIFTDEDFLPSEVTNRPAIEIRPISPAYAEDDDDGGNVVNQVGAIFEVETTDHIDLDATLEEVQPYPKAGPRKATKRGRKPRKTAILTDPQEMETLRAEQKAVADKKKKRCEAQTARAEKKTAKEVEKRVKAATKKTVRPKSVQKPIPLEPQPSTSGPHRPTTRGNKGTYYFSSTDSSDNDGNVCDAEQNSEGFCCECNEILAYVITNIKCVKCPNRAHFECSGAGMTFMCQDCQSGRGRQLRSRQEK